MIKKIFKKINIFINTKRNNYIYGKKLKKYSKKSKIPVLICSFNRYHFLKKIVAQLNKLKIIPIIIDNNSKQKKLLDFYKNKKFRNNFYLLKLKKNYGHNVIYENFIFKNLPCYVAYTDPDIEINKNIKENFLEILKDYTEKYQIQKVGFAINDKNLKNINIRIGARNKTNQIIEKVISLKTAMKKNREIIENNPRVFKSKIDTTFALYNKKFIKKNKLEAISIGDDFTCKHLPWEKNYNLPKTEHNEYMDLKLKNISSTII
jgi:hypothetical protein